MTDNVINNEKPFGFFRGMLFPIYSHELKRFLPMALMMLFILFNYTILRNIKDSLVINARGSDADIIAFLKLWGTTPSAIIFMLAYSKLLNLMNRENVFYVCLLPFLIFFGAFAFFIYPNVELLHPNVEWVASLQQEFPRFKWFISMWGNWTYVVFYILAELWGSVMLSLLFWQFANEITPTQQAKRFYPLFGFVGNLGLIFSGYIVRYFSDIQNVVQPGQDPWQMTLNNLMSAIVISGFVIGALYWWVNRIKEPKQEATGGGAVKKSKKPKLSITESFKHLVTSPHLICIATIVFAYGITINFLDVLWKGQVKIHTHGDPNAYSTFMGNFSLITGYIALPLMLIGGNILRKFTWLQAAAVVPTILLVTGVGFYGVILWGMGTDPNSPLLSVAGVSLTAAGLAAQFGLWQNALTKATKYSLFDATKEMAYIPLDEEVKTKGKAAVDVVGGRAGKSGGSLTFVVLQMLLPGFTLPMLTPFIAGISLVILAAWYLSLRKLNGSLVELQQSNDTKANGKSTELTLAA